MRAWSCWLCAWDAVTPDLNRPTPWNIALLRSVNAGRHSLEKELFRHGDREPEVGTDETSFTPMNPGRGDADDGHDDVVEPVSSFPMTSLCAAKACLPRPVIHHGYRPAPLECHPLRTRSSVPLA